MAQDTNGTLDEVAELAQSTRTLWKLTEPWTHSTRPPLLGKRTERVSHSYHRFFSSQITMREETKWYKDTKIAKGANNTWSGTSADDESRRSRRTELRVLRDLRELRG